MKNNFKHLLPQMQISKTWWMLVLFLLTTTMAVRADDYTYITNSDGTLTLTAYAGSGGDVIISPVIEGRTVTVIGDHAFYGNRSLLSVTIPDSVTSVEYSVFKFCTSLTNVVIGSGVTSIGEGAFDGCSSLPSVTIPDSVTSVEDYVFMFCTNLTNVVIGNGVTSIGRHVFLRCDILTVITVDAGNSAYSSVNGVLFNKNQTVLVLYPVGKDGSYTIPDSVTSIGDRAFYGSYRLPSVAIPDSVTNIGYEAFDGCSSLLSVTIPDSVTSIGDGAFGWCSSLTSVTIPDSVTSIGDFTFWRCYRLPSVAIPDSVTNIGNFAFYYCYLLADMTVGAAVTNIGDEAYSGCYKLRGVYFMGNAPTIGEGVFTDDYHATIYYLPGTTGWGWTFGGRPAMPWWDGPQISANDSREDVSLNSGDPVKITVATEENNLAAAHLDWWIIAWANDSMFYLNNSREWIQFDGKLSNCRPVYQGRLFNLPSTEVLNTTELPIGSYTFWFAVDYPMDGILNLGGYILIDSVNVIVE